MQQQFDSYNSLFEHIFTEQSAYNFAVEHRLIKLSGRLCECGALLRVELDSCQAFGVRFRCSAPRSQCRKSYSILHGTWFANSKLSLRDQTLMIYCYALEVTSLQLRGIFGLGSYMTVADWANYEMDISVLYLSELSCWKIGGPGRTVEINETQIFKNKNNQGRLIGEQSRGEWLFGGICRETKETFFIMVPNRSEATLMEALQTYVVAGTRILSDGWAAYCNISSYGFTHDWVNHSENFILPEDGEIHTQTIERTWRGVKENIPPGTRYEGRMRRIINYSFKRHTGWSNLSIGQRFELLVDLISRFY
jgi:hypothetical protein